jgi:hypothetical protein
LFLVVLDPCGVHLIAKDVNTNSLPGVMFKSNIKINSEDLAEIFASYFDLKVCGPSNPMTNS